MLKYAFTLVLCALMCVPYYANAQGCEASAGDDEALKVFGFLQSEYDYQFTDKGESSFGFRRARLGVTGNIPYDFSYNRSQEIFYLIL